ncbi:hypothetical protein DND132_1442 [Pseudodesulfovibrio mercurii]|uniref:Uncharacterized protein n=1 Tax=Pseudodesulfovibrio mercurii TaxID=641491 RepID=F0JE41_9BACT|nr:WYL domain-containing protein [Pseudodesulfovibrio mercurii]EGB14650.1 hypothetical protein DND132_1442 [Pseudodesulfovibrio mercurii]
MPPKLDPTTTSAQKLISLYSLLLFTGRTYSLTGLARHLDCSKQTILRLVDALEAGSWARIESFRKGGQRWYRMVLPEQRPKLSLAPEEMQKLALCRDLVLHLLPPSLRESVGNSLSKTGVMLPDLSRRAEALRPVAASRTKGKVDYASFQDRLEALLAAVHGRNICELTYHAANASEPKSYHFAPMRLVCFHDALYVLGHVVSPSSPWEIRHTITLAVQRLVDIAVTADVHDFPPVEEGAGSFGFMPGTRFRVVVRFDESVARYVSERVWSEDQAVTLRKDGSLDLAMSATSRSEVLAWVLGFGELAEILEPAELREAIAEKMESMLAAYR